MSSLSLGFAKNSFCKPPLAGMEGGYAASLPPAGALATGQQVESSGLQSRAELHGKDAVVKEGIFPKVGSTKELLLQQSFHNFCKLCEFALLVVVSKCGCPQLLVVPLFILFVCFLSLKLIEVACISFCVLVTFDLFGYTALPFLFVKNAYPCIAFGTQFLSGV